MSIFNRAAPGVEWNDSASEATVPMRPQEPSSPYPAACVACGGELGIDGYCLQCGQKARSLREHYELTPVDWVAGICDIGLLHSRNEDALAVRAEGPRAVIVVCDGVTTSDDSDVASMAAATTVCDLLWMNDPQGTGTPSSRNAAIQSLLTQAVTEANEAVIDSTDPASSNSAATTIAMAVVDGHSIYCANLGDSRIYWLPDDADPCQLTRDHSLAQDGIDSGTGRAEAESSIFAHTITKWLGRDAVDLDPYLSTTALDRPGWLIACSDGLWNYVSEATAVRDLVASFGEDSSAVGLASHLVAWANQQGGHDNITVVCARLVPQDSPPSPEPIADSMPEPTSDSSPQPTADSTPEPTEPLSAEATRDGDEQEPTESDKEV